MISTFRTQVLPYAEQMALDVEASALYEARLADSPSYMNDSDSSSRLNRLEMLLH